MHKSYEFFCFFSNRFLKLDVKREEGFYPQLHLAIHHVNYISVPTHVFHSVKFSGWNECSEALALFVRECKAS